MFWWSLNKHDSPYKFGNGAAAPLASSMLNTWGCPPDCRLRFPPFSTLSSSSHTKNAIISMMVCCVRKGIDLMLDYPVCALSHQITHVELNMEGILTMATWRRRRQISALLTVRSGAHFVSGRVGLRAFFAPPSCWLSSCFVKSSSATFLKNYWDTEKNWALFCW